MSRPTANFPAVTDLPVDTDLPEPFETIDGDPVQPHEHGATGDDSNYLSVCDHLFKIGTDLDRLSEAFNWDIVD